MTVYILHEPYDVIYGVYSTREKALKSLEKLRRRYKKADEELPTLSWTSNAEGTYISEPENWLLTQILMNAEYTQDSQLSS